MDYRVFEPKAGLSLAQVVATLMDYAKNGQFYMCNFNGHPLYSDTVSYDSAFRTVMQVSYRDYLQQQQYNHYFNGTQNTSTKSHALQYRDLAAAYLPSQAKLQLWNKFVDESDSKGFNGAELEATLSLLQTLCNGDLDKAATYISNLQGSKEFRNLVLRMTVNLSVYGEQFLTYLKQMRDLRMASEVVSGTDYFK